MTERKTGRSKNNMPNDIEKHLLIDDFDIGAIPKHMQIKVGAFLTNMMCKNLKFKMNNHKFMLLKPQVFKTKKKT